MLSDDTVTCVNSKTSILYMVKITINNTTVNHDVSPFKYIYSAYLFMKFWPENLVVYVLNHPASNPVK